MSSEEGTNLAGGSTVDDHIKEAVLEATDHFLKWFADLRPVDATIRGFSPITRWAIGKAPFAVTEIVGRLPRSAFKSNKFAQHFFDWSVDTSRKVSAIVEEKGPDGVTKDDLKKVFEDSRKTFFAQPVVLIENIYHRGGDEGCPD